LFKSKRGIAGLAFLFLGAVSFSLATGSASAQGPNDPPPGLAVAANHVPVCPDRGPDAARCHAHVVADPDGKARTNTTPAGYGPAQFQTAYGLPSSSAGSGMTIAIVDAYDNPRAESDLGVYSSQFGLPQCTTANGCFKKVNQSGGSNYPRSNSGWGLEIALDIQVAHAVCPLCHILLVEANSNSFNDLLAAEDYAAGHANVVSNSWGANEFSSETVYDSHFNHSGVPITFSSGDSGYGVEYPAASQYVTAVGGTKLSVGAGNVRSSETVWNGAGSGCSAYEAKPSWQTDSGCGGRTVADVSADADPNTGAAVYDSCYSSFGRFCSGGWFQVGGTSLASPLIAAVYALASGGVNTSYPYGHTGSLFDVTSGSNGNCGGSYLCTGGVGYDGPSGLGTPNGSGGF
jgi:subtilase family serine protease